MSTPKSKKGASSALTPPTKKLRNNRGVAQNPILRGTLETSLETPQDPNGSNDEGEDEDDVDYVSDVDDDGQDNIEATPSMDDFMDQVLLLNHKRQSPWTERDAPSCATFVALQVVSQQLSGRHTRYLLHTRQAKSQKGLPSNSIDSSALPDSRLAH